MENTMAIPQNIKNRATIRSSNFTSGYLSEETKNTNLKKICTPVFTAALLVIGKIWKQPVHPSTDEWIYTKWNYYSTLKKMKFCHFVTTGRNLEGIMLNKISRIEKDKYYTTSSVCGVWKQNENQLTDTGGGGGWAKWVKWVKRYKLPIIKPINHGEVVICTA